MTDRIASLIAEREEQSRRAKEVERIAELRALETTQAAARMVA